MTITSIRSSLVRRLLHDTLMPPTLSPASQKPLKHEKLHKRHESLTPHTSRASSHLWPLDKRRLSESSTQEHVSTQKLVLKDLCPSCYGNFGWLCTGNPSPAYHGTNDSIHIGNIVMAARDLTCPICTLLFSLASEAAILARLPGAAGFGMYSLHTSKLSSAFFKTKDQLRSLDDDPHVFYIAPLFSIGQKARDWALRHNSCFMRLGPESKGIFARQLLPKADLGFVRSWVQYCNRCHTHEDCNTPGWSESDPDLTVIDCETRDLVVLPAGSAYITLSYVWGTNPAPATSDRGRLPSGLPQLIEDSILVTAALGYRFLWIDRYCISESTKASLIRRMDRIYSSSSLTIIASASEEPSLGLIGLGKDRQQLPHAVHLQGGLALSQISTRLAHEVQTSKWNTRAWTYQEGFLSNRRLVFAQSQVYFECGETWCTEGLHIPLDTLVSPEHCRIERVFPWVANKHPPAVSAPCNRREQAEAYFVARVREYMRRELTYQSDAFDAFAGVLNYLESFTAEFLLGHIVGLPIWSPGSRWSTASCAHDALLYSLAWSISRPRDESTGKDGWPRPSSIEHSVRFFLNTHAARRRSEFPSWIWCGWQLPMLSSGRIEWRTHPVPTTDNIAIPVDLSIESQNGTVNSWARLSDPAALLKEMSSSKPSAIHARGMLSPLLIPANCWNANYDGECQCGPYRMRRRDVQYLNLAATRNLSTADGSHVLTAWFCHALEFSAEEDTCRTEVMVLVPTSTVGTFERLDVMCQVKMEYFVARPSVEVLVQRFGWRHEEFRIV